MIERLIARVLALALAVGTAGVLGVSPAQAYEGCQGQSTASVSLVNVLPDQIDTGTATFADCNGQPDAGAHVHYVTVNSPGPNCQASFSPLDDTTDSQGKVLFHFTLPPGCPGTYTLGIELFRKGTGLAPAGNGVELAAERFPAAGPEVADSAPPLFTLLLTVREIGGFPNTTADPPGVSAGLLVIAAGLALFGAGLSGVQLNRRRRRR